MSDQSELWAAVVVSYDAAGLRLLTNIRNRAATTVNTTTGEDAAKAVIDLWPVYAQVEYDSTNVTHVEVGKRGTIAVLWSRGGSSSAIAKVEWDEVFSPDGMITRIKNTSARAHGGPVSNSGVSQKSELVNGRRIRPWSQAPLSNLPRNVVAND